MQITRPGKTAGSSASIGYLGPGAVKTWSSSWAPLRQGAVYAADELNHIADLMEAGDEEGARRGADPIASVMGDAQPTVAEADDTPHFATYNPAQAFPLEGVWPPSLVAFIRQLGVATSVDSAMVATLTLPVLAAAIGNSVAIQMSSTWQERGNLWTVVVAPPSVGKSPVGRVVRAPLQAIQRDADAVYLSQREQWEIMGGAKEPPPTARHVLAQNTTVEALAEAMQGHPRSTLLYRDELTGWFDP